jgi:hypothetical protein
MITHSDEARLLAWFAWFAWSEDEKRTAGDVAAKRLDGEDNGLLFGFQGQPGVDVRYKDYAYR